MNVLEEYAENKDACAYLYVLTCERELARTQETEVNANSSTHRSLTMESQLSTLAVNVPAY